MKNSLLLLLLSFFCLSQNLKAQTPPYYVIGENEFSNTDVYSLHFQEAENILYAATDKGVYCYKQNSFNLIESAEEQHGSSFFSLIENDLGNVFCCNLSGQVFEIKGNKLHLYFELPTNETTKNCKIFFDKKDNLIVCADTRIRSVSTDKDVSIIDTGEKIVVNQTSQLTDGRILFHSWKNQKIYAFDGKISLLTVLDGDNSINKIFNLGDDIYFGSDELKKINDTSFSMNLSFMPKSIMYQKNNQEVFFTSQEGLYSIKNNNTFRKIILGFKNQFVSAITENNRGTIFLGTFKDGVIVIPNRHVTKYQVDHHFTGIVSDPITNTIRLSDKKNKIYEHKDSLSYFGHFNLSLDQLFFVNGDYKVNDYRFHKFIYQTPGNEFILRSANNIKDLYEYKNEFFCYISADKVHFVLTDSVSINNPKFANLKTANYYSFNLSSRGKSVCFNENTLYYSTIKGLFGKRWDTGYAQSILYRNKEVIANDLTTNNEFLVIGTEKNGILFYKNDKFHLQIDGEDGLQSNTIKKIETQNDLLFIQTAHGFQIFDLILNRFIGLGDREGVTSNAIYNFTLTNDRLWLLEKSGYSFLKLEDIGQNQETKLPKLYLDSILVNNKRNINENIFSFDENNVKFYFDYRSFETKKDAKYYCKLKGGDEWKVISTKNNLMEYHSLSPGKYEFQIKVVYRNLESNTIKYEFTIQQPFWFQLWFIVTCFLGVILSIFVLFYFKIRRNKKERKSLLHKQKMQSDIFESKLKAIRSQMNPHFIFNSLNSIQSLVLKENKELSYDSIEQFSELVRKTLQFSEKNFVPIKEEITFLQIYMELESLRMKDDFTFSLKNLYSRNINIPSLLIQPFIENSIHHGLLHKDGEKKLEITFYKENNETYCSIVDNGIGRVEAKEINERQNNMHQSFSLNAMKDRLKILSQQHNVEYNYKITDLFNDLNQAIGTKVVIHFPFQDEY